MNSKQPMMNPPQPPKINLPQPPQINLPQSKNPIPPQEIRQQQVIKPFDQRCEEFLQNLQYGELLRLFQNSNMLPCELAIYDPIIYIAMLHTPDILSICLNQMSEFSFEKKRIKLSRRGLTENFLNFLLYEFDIWVDRNKQLIFLLKSVNYDQLDYSCQRFFIKLLNKVLKNKQDISRWIQLFVESLKSSSINNDRYIEDVFYQLEIYNILLTMFQKNLTESIPEILFYLTHSFGLNGIMLFLYKQYRCSIQ